MSIEPSTEPLAGEAAATPAQSARCSGCDAPIAPDQRYCLQCGERLAPISGFLMGRHAGAPGVAGASGEQPLSPPGAPPTPHSATAPRSNLLGVLAGVGVLLLAMGVGVLIGRAGNSKPAPAREQVITQVAPISGTGTAEASFTSDWPASRSGYTVELSTLPSSSTVAAVQAAKTAAGAKGPPAVGALDSGEFASLPSGHYVIYSGVYHSGAEAKKALAGVRGKFPAATVIHVSSSGSGSDSAGGGSSSGGSSSVGSSVTHPAPPSVLKSLKGKGKNYEEASKNLPDVVETE